MEYILPSLLLFLSANIAICSAKDIDCAALMDGRDPRKKVPCVLPNPNVTSCGAIGCCWDSTAPKLKCFTVEGGKCFVNPVPACQEIINTTLLDHRDTPRFVDNKLGVPITERFLREMLNIIDQHANEDKECLKILKTMLCHYTLPPCGSGGTIRTYCREDCEAIFTKCRDPLNKAIGAAEYYSKVKKIDFSHISFPNCSVYKPSSYYINKKYNETCVKTGFFNFDEDEKKTDILPIILPIFFVLIIVVTVAVVLIVVRHRRQRRAMKNSKLMLSDGALTMREKLRADSLKSMDLLRLYDPSKVKHYALDNVEYIKDLGEGHFGKVFQGRAVGMFEGKPREETMVAVKALKEGSSKEIKAEFFQEVALMSIFEHPNIVSLIAVSTEEEPYGMIFEYMTGGDLNHYLRHAQPAETSLDSQDAKVYLSQEDLLKISEQIAAGMEEVSKLKFVHRDLATRNCLVGKDLVIKIADFGMSRDIYQSNYYKMSRETLLPIRWLAPEAFLYGKFTIMSDIYSYGVVLWEIYTFGLQPYYGYNNVEVTNFIKQGIHLGKPDNCPDFMYTLMKDCWQQTPTDRPDFALIQQRLRDPYGNYDKPKAQSDDSVDAGVPVERQISGSQDLGDYDIPKPNADEINMYDNPRSPVDVDLSQNYDIPKALGENELEHDYDVPDRSANQEPGKGTRENSEQDRTRRENTEQDRARRENSEQDRARRENSEQDRALQDKGVSEESKKPEEKNRKQKEKPRRNSKQKKQETGKPNEEKTKERRPSKNYNQKRDEYRKSKEDVISDEGQLNDDQLNRNTESGRKKSGGGKKDGSTYTTQPSIEV